MGRLVAASQHCRGCRDHSSWKVRVRRRHQQQFAAIRFAETEVVMWTLSAGTGGENTTTPKLRFCVHRQVSVRAYPFQPLCPSSSFAPPSTVQVWTLRTGRDASEDDLLSILNEAELARSAQFLREVDRESYLGTRAALRTILSDAVGVAPGAIRLSQNPWGKPLLAAEHGCRDLDFSVSHSVGLSVIALSRSGAVGIDIEHRRAVLERDRIIADVLGDRVAAPLAALPAHRQGEAFFRLWTAAEAMVKAAGTGFAGAKVPLPLALSADGTPQLLPHRDFCGARWSLHSFDPAPGYVGSLVVEADDQVPAS